MKSENIDQLAIALSKVQAQITGAKANARNNFSKYSNLAKIWDSIRKPLTESGLCVIQTTEVRDEKLGVVTRLVHISGQWVEGFTPILNNKNDAPGMGSGMTYARRYALAAIVGIYQEDDDGKAASKPEPKRAEPKPIIKQEQSKSEYVCTAGKFAGKAIKDVPASELRSYCETLELAIDENQKASKPSPLWAIEFVAEARKVLI